jgi:hypothetical protein
VDRRFRASWVAIVGTTLVLAGCQATNPSPSVVSPTPTPPPASSPVTPGPTVEPASPTPPPPTSTPEPTAPPAASATPNATAVPPTSGPPSPQPTIALSATGAPSLPTKVNVDTTTDACDLGTGEACATWRATWQAVPSPGVTIRVYGVTTCLHEPTPSSSGEVKCLSNGDTIPSKSLTLLAAAPGADGSVTFQLATGEGTALGWLPGGGPQVYAIVVQAVNASGGSSFVFAAVSGSVYGNTL